MSSNDDETAAVLQLIADSRLTGYLAVASLCVLIYDHIVCFNEEVELMWKSHLGLAKIIYLWNRYFSLIAICLNTSVIVREIASETVSNFHLVPARAHAGLSFSGGSCMNWLKVQGVTSTVIIGTVDFVLMLRVWILFGRPRVLVWLFAGMAIAEVTTMIVVDFLAYAQMTKYVHLGSILKGCYAYNVPRFLTLYAAVPLFVTFVMFAMTVYKCCTTLNWNSHHVMPVWKLFLRDGVVWFLAVFAAAGAELLIWTMRRETLKQLLVVPALVVYSTVASRTLLNIKALMVGTEPHVQMASTRPVDSIVFVSV
ncbi:hypothetical protein B0H17DRAFT_1210055 [Mycena rosella]|uniref:DUF6533 domain-containing protein n=1 Tax=Mycena rosella TaxID=1033263 RepID=A0AAD7CXM3_MYCRO|nr:hypothetical protein B0H17DRAFT_1210055 [Mycena rosella]